MTNRPDAIGPAGARLRVAYAVGAGHSGTTLLALLMDSHPEIASVGETSPTRKIQARGAAGLTCSCGEGFSACPFWQRVFARVNQAGFDLSQGNWSHDHRYKNPLLHRLLTRYPRFRAVRGLQQTAEALVPGHRARLARADRANVAFVRAVLEETGAAVFFDTSKHPLRLHHLLRLPELDVRVVIVLRDVRGFVGSAKRRGRDIRWAATTWRNHQRAVADVTGRLEPGRVLSIRYEEFCASPREWQRRLYAFVGVAPIEPPSDVAPHEHHVLGNRLRRSRRTMAVRPADGWGDVLTPGEAEEVLRIAGDVNRALGYG